MPAVAKVTRKRKARGNGDGTVYFDREKRRYVAKITLPDGKRKKWVFATQTEAKDKLLALQAEQRPSVLPTDERRQALPPVAGTPLPPDGSAGV